MDISNVGCTCNPQPKFLFFVAASRQQGVKDFWRMQRLLGAQKGKSNVQGLFRQTLNEEQ
jgi:hypothetical protein